jgi:glutamyl-tRNA reductase
MISANDSLDEVITEHPAEARPEGRAAPTILCVGVSHRTAPVSLRERLALGADVVSSVLSRFGCGDDARPADVSELVILSTCNRLELYASGGHRGADALLSLIEEQTGVTRRELEGSIYRLTGADAVRHLCRTAAGLDSMVIGEPQILGQISSAFAAAVAQRAAGHALSTLFRGAIRAGRRARTETGINRHPATVSSIAVKLVSDTVGDLDAATIVVLGGGEMAELAVAAMHQRGARRICVVTRTPAHAARLVDEFGVRVSPLERLEPELCDADVLITSTSAPHHVVSREMVETAMVFHGARPLVIVDIAMPRDVEPSVRNLDGVRYWDLDDLQQGLRGTLSEREAEVPHAERVVEEAAANCLADLRQLDVQPLIGELRARAESIRLGAMDRAMRELPGLSLAERRSLDVFSQSLVNKLLHQPMVRLREEAKRGQAAGYVMAVRHLFGLEA